ncbi:MAG TPA: tetratricopeptide repeat protein [Phycisphaerales bacterium]|nr:tetratricopeptide repeat protein [Phycisphaerales bacterium]HRQ74515.1 tetratricopeptide repeat protein [Phycisphaerales bacterium]
MKHLIILFLIWATVAGTGCGGGETPDSQGSTAAPPTHEAVDAALATAEDLFHSADNVRAEAVLVRLIERAPRDPRARELYAMVLLSRAAEAREAGDVAGERVLLTQAHGQYAVLVEMRPQSAGLRQSAGEVAQMAGLPEQALAHYQEARRLSPGETKPVFFAAQAMIELGRLDDAKAALHEALEIDSDEPMVHASLGNLLAEQGDFERALSHIAEARTIDPGQVTYRVIEASIHRRSGHPAKAIELLMPLSDAHRAREVVASELAASFLASDQPDRAAEAWSLMFEAQRVGARAAYAAAQAGLAVLEAGERERAWLWLQQARRASAGIDVPELHTLEQAIASSAQR